MAMQSVYLQKCGFVAPEKDFALLLKEIPGQTPLDPPVKLMSKLRPELKITIKGPWSTILWTLELGK